MLELVSVAYLHPQYSTVLHQWEYHASSVLKCDTVKSPRGSKKKQHGHLLLSLKQQLEIALGSMSRGPARQHVLWTSQAASPVDQPGSKSRGPARQAHVSDVLPVHLLLDQEGGLQQGGRGGRGPRQLRHAAGRRQPGCRAGHPRITNTSCRAQEQYATCKARITQQSWVHVCCPSL